MAFLNFNLIDTGETEMVNAFIKDVWNNHPDPTSYIARQSVNNVIADAYPNFNRKEIDNMAPHIIKAATGYDMDHQSAWDAIQETFRQTKTQMEASQSFFNVYAGAFVNGSFNSESFESKKAKFFEEMEKQKQPYRTDFMDMSVLTDLAVASASLLPYSLDSMKFYAAGGLLSAATGNAAPLLLAKAASGVNVAMKEAGSIGLELAKMQDDKGNKLDDGLIWAVMAMVGIANGTLEVAFDAFPKGVAELVKNGAAKVFGKQTVKTLVKSGTLKQWAMQAIRRYGSQMGQEMVTEAMQELVSMLGQNIAADVGSKDGGTFSKHEFADFKKAMVDVSIQTAKGMVLTGLPSNVMTTLNEWKTGDPAIIRDADKYTERSEKSTLIGMGSIVVPEGAKAAETITPSDSPIQVVKIGGLYKPVDAQDASNIAAMKKAGVKGLSIEVVNATAEATEESNSSAKRLAAVLDVGAVVNQIVFDTQEEAKKTAEAFASSSTSVVGYTENADGSVTVVRNKNGKQYSIVFTDKSLTKDAEKVSMNDETAPIAPRETAPAAVDSAPSVEKVKSGIKQTWERYNTALDALKVDEDERNFMKTEIIGRMAKAYQQAKPDVGANTAYEVGIASAYVAKLFARITGSSTTEFFEKYFTPEKFVAMTSKELAEYRNSFSFIIGSMTYAEQKGITDPMEMLELSKKLYPGAYINNDKDGKYTIHTSKAMSPLVYVHELSHALVDIIKDTDAFAPFKEVYAEELAKDGGKVGTAFQEKFATDLELYIANGHVRDERMRTIFERIVEAVKDLKRYIDRKLAPEARKAFDDLFDLGNQKQFEAKGLSVNEAQAEKISDAVNMENPDEAASRISFAMLENVDEYTADEIMDMSEEQYTALFDTANHSAQLGTLRSDKVKKMVDPIKEKTSIGMGIMYANRYNNDGVDLIKKLADVFKSYDINDLKGLDDDQVLTKMKEFMKDNLKAILASLPEEFIRKSKQWYVSANKLARVWADMYGKKIEQVAAAIAALSPQKDWEQNVSLAQRLLDILANEGSMVWTPEMDTITGPKGIKIYKPDYKMKGVGKEKTYVLDANGNKILNNKKNMEMLDDVRGKRLSEVKGKFERAVWIRAYDEAHNPRSYRGFSPDGKFLDFVLTKKGKKQSVAWGSFNEIANAVSAIENEDIESLSESLGVKHKVRSFYNNILIPNSPDQQVTIDTHAVGAALFLAVSGTTTGQVVHNFGGSVKDSINPASNGAYAISGSYALYADAYREAADELGMLPRELQSITWTAIRYLFDEDFKNKTNMDEVKKIWQNGIRKGESFDAIRQQVIQFALQQGGAFGDGLLEKSNSGLYSEEGLASYERKLSRPQLREFGSGDSAGGRGGDNLGLQKPGVKVSDRGRGRADSEGLQGGGLDSLTTLYALDESSVGELLEGDVKRQVETGHYPKDEDLMRFAGKEWADREIQFRRILNQDPRIMGIFMDAYEQLQSEIDADEVAGDQNARLIDIINEKVPESERYDLGETQGDQMRFIERIKQQAQFMTASKADALMRKYLDDTDYLYMFINRITDGLEMDSQTDISPYIMRYRFRYKPLTPYAEEKARKAIKDDLRKYRRMFLEKNGATQQLSYEIATEGTVQDTGASSESLDNSEVRNLLSDKKIDPVVKSIIRKNLANGRTLQGLIDAMDIKTRELMAEIGKGELTIEKLMEMVEQGDEDYKRRNAGYLELQEKNEFNYEQLRRYKRLLKTMTLRRDAMAVKAALERTVRIIDKLANKTGSLDVEIMDKLVKFHHIMKADVLEDTDISDLFESHGITLEELHPAFQKYFVQNDKGIFFARRLKDMSIGQLEQLRNEMRQVRSEARRVYEDRRDAQKDRVFPTASKYLGSAHGIQSESLSEYRSAFKELKSESPIKGSHDSVEKSQKNKVKAFIDTMLLTPSRLILKIDPSGELYKWFFGVNGVDKILADEHRAMDDRYAKGSAMMKSLGIKDSELTKTHISVRGIKLTLDEAIGVYVYSQQPEAVAKLVSADGNRMTQEDIDSIVASLSENHKKWGDILIEDMTSRHGALADVYHKVSNKMLGMVVKYFPLVRGDKEATMVDMLDEEYYDREEAPSQQMLKERVGGKYPLALNATSTWNRMVRKQEHYIAAAQWVSDTQFMLRKTGGDLYDSIALSKGSKYAEALQDFVDNFANKHTIQDNASTLVNAIRNNLIVARLGFNILTALKQIPSLTYFVREFGPVRLIESLGQVLLHGKTTSEFIYERAPQLRNRSVSTEFSAIAEMEGKTAYQRVVKSVGDAGMWPIKIMDKMVVNTLWLGAYNAKLSNGLSPEVAAIEATRFIGDTQPGGGVANSAAIYGSNDMLVKFLTMFSNQLNKNFNIIYADIPYALKHKMYKDAIANMLGLGLGFAGIILASGGFIDDDNDDDEYGEQVLKQFAGQILTQMPIFGKDATNILLDQYYSDNGMLLVSETNSLIKALVSKDPERVADRATKFGVGVMETMGLPSGITDKGRKAVFEDEEINLAYFLNSTWGKYFIE